MPVRKGFDYLTSLTRHANNLLSDSCSIHWVSSAKSVYWLDFNRFLGFLSTFTLSSDTTPIYRSHLMTPPTSWCQLFLYYFLCLWWASLFSVPTDFSFVNELANAYFLHSISVNDHSMEPVFPSLSSIPRSDSMGGTSSTLLLFAVDRVPCAGDSCIISGVRGFHTRRAKRDLRCS